MNDILSDTDIAQINTDHCTEIRKLLQPHIINGGSTQSEPPTRAEFLSLSREYAQAYRLGYDGRVRNGDPLLDVFSTLGDDPTEIPMSELMASADRQHAKVLEKPFFVEETSNRDNVFAKYIYDNIEALIQHVPVRCRDFYLLPIQRVAIIAMTTPMPVETFTEVHIPRSAMEELSESRCRKMPYKVRYSLEANMLPSITLASYCTGSGKTIMATMAALSLLCSADKWAALRASYRDIMRSRIREADSGLAKGEELASMQLARLAIIFAPPSMMTHWFNTAKSAVHGFKEQSNFTEDIIVWRGYSSYHNIAEAHALNKPVLLIVPLESAMKDLERKTPGIGYAVRIFDELNLPMSARYDQPESVPCFTYITQATIELLRNSTDRQPRHPLRLAYKGPFAPVSYLYSRIRGRSWKDVQTILEQYAKTRQFAPPEFLRSQVSLDVQHNMPKGVTVQRLSVRTGTLAASVMGSEIINVTLPNLVRHLMSTSIQNHVKDQIAGIFERAEMIKSAEILSELSDIMHNLPVTTLAENNSKCAVQRLQERLREIFTGDMPSDPITLEEIPRENVRILRCCTAVIDVESLKCCNRKCPLCRAPINHVCTIAEPSESEPKTTALGKRKFNFDDDDSEDETTPDEAFAASIKELSSKREYFTDGVIEALKVQVDQKNDSRILLCSGFGRMQHSCSEKLIDKITRKIPHVKIFNMDKLQGKSDASDALAVYTQPHMHKHPVILLISTDNDSSSVQGLNLHCTDLTVIASRCSTGVQRQAAGRSLRMRKRPANMKPEDRFPAKRMLIVSVDNSAR